MENREYTKKNDGTFVKLTRMFQKRPRPVYRMSQKPLMGHPTGSIQRAIVMVIGWYKRYIAFVRKSLEKRAMDQQSKKVHPFI